MKGAGLLVHGGGPTQVMNASLAGVVEESRGCADIEALYGARHGIDGVLAADFFDLGAQPEALISRLAHTPGRVLAARPERSLEFPYTLDLRLRTSS